MSSPAVDQRIERPARPVNSGRGDLDDDAARLDHRAAHVLPALGFVGAAMGDAGVFGRSLA